MSWSVVVSALEEGGSFRSRVSLYMHPLAGRPILWHVLGVYGEVSPRAEHAVVVHREESALMVPEGPGIATTLIGAAPGDEVAIVHHVIC